MFWSPQRSMCAIAIVATSHYGKKQKDSEQNKQLSCDFSVCYITSYLANVCFYFPVCLFTVFRISRTSSQVSLFFFFHFPKR